MKRIFDIFIEFKFITKFTGTYLSFAIFFVCDQIRKKKKSL